MHTFTNQQIYDEIEHSGVMPEVVYYVKVDDMNTLNTARMKYLIANYEPHLVFNTRTYIHKFIKDVMSGVFDKEIEKEMNK